jgi:hypothetical protein
MKKALALSLLALGFVTTVEAAEVVTKAAPKAKVAKGREKNKKLSRKTAALGKKEVVVVSAAPASAESVVQVHSENTDFESLVREQQELGRRPAGFAGNARVIGLRRELGLTRADADSAPQDIVLNAGYKQGISQGMVLEVARKVPILDPYKDNQQSELTVKFASIRVVHVEDELSVARLERTETIRSGVGVGVRGVLVGDYVGNTK